MPHDSTVREIKEHAWKIAVDFYNAVSPVFDGSNVTDGDVAAGRFDPKELKKRTRSGLRTTARRGGTPGRLTAGTAGR
jgi:hypothetical protein